MNNNDPFASLPSSTEPGMPSPKRRSPVRMGIASVLIGILVIAGIYAVEIVKSLLVQGAGNVVSTAVYARTPTVTSLANGPAVRPSGADAEALGSAILSDSRIKDVQVLFNSGPDLTQGGADWMVVNITLKQPCSGASTSSSCVGIDNDLAGLIFRNYPNVKQLGGIALNLNGKREFSAPIDIWEQLVVTPQP